MSIAKLNLSFESHTKAKASDMNKMSDKIDELISESNTARDDLEKDKVYNESVDVLKGQVKALQETGIASLTCPVVFMEEAALEGMTVTDMTEDVIYIGLEEYEEEESATYDTETGVFTSTAAYYDPTTGLLTIPNATYDSSNGLLTI